MNALPQPQFPNHEPPKAVAVRRSNAARWKTIAVSVASGFGVLLVVVLLGVVALLHSERFHAYLLRTAQQRASEAFGSQVQMKDFAIHWSGISPTADLYDVVVHGAAPYPNPPLLQADALHLGVTVTSLLHKAWYVNDVRIEHPVVRIFADSNGHTNLPPSKQEQPGPQSRTSVFDLGVRHFQVCLEDMATVRRFAAEVAPAFE